MLGSDEDLPPCFALSHSVFSQRQNSTRMKARIPHPERAAYSGPWLVAEPAEVDVERRTACREEETEVHEAAHDREKSVLTR